jgi:hypothetical protein
MDQTVRVRVVWKWGAKMSENEGSKGSQRVISRGAALARCRQATVISLLSPDINVQFAGVEMMDSRQCRHTCVSGTIEIAS